jgi:hypothetical protein
MVGYSGTPLAKKLGIKEGSRVMLLNAPEAFCGWLAPLPDGVTFLDEAEEQADVIVAFFDSSDLLAASIETLINSLAVDGGLWIAWPKRASKVPTDITEDVLRVLFLDATPMVDNKVCAISEVWSGLRFVRRRHLR